MSLSIPRVETRGRYEVIGQVLLLPVRSAGEFWTEFSEYIEEVLVSMHNSENPL